VGYSQPTTKGTEMGKNLKAVAAVAALALSLGAAACTGTGTTTIPTFVPTPFPTGGATQTPTGTSSAATPTVTASAVAGAVTRGTATASLTGSISHNSAFGALGTPAVWSPPPGAMNLSWNDTTGASLNLTGASFTGQQQTSATLTLAFAVNLSSGASKSFRSQAGECSVSITTALTTQLSGIFFCTNLKSVDGLDTVNVQGSFNAAG